MAEVVELFGDEGEYEGMPEEPPSPSNRSSPETANENEGSKGPRRANTGRWAEPPREANG